MNWTYYDPSFESEPVLNDLGSAWAGHRYFAYDLIANIKPKTVVELGTHWGTSFFAFCQAVKDNNLECELFAVDSWKGDPHASFYGQEVYESVKEITSKFYSCLHPHLLKMNFDDAIEKFANNSVDLLHIDGYHTYEAVRHDFESWIGKVSANGIILFHDTAEKKDDFGVFRFWDQIKKKFNTIEFYHSHGLGVLIKDPDAQGSFNLFKDIWARYYYVYHENKKLGNTISQQITTNKTLNSDLLDSRREIDNLNINIERKGNELIGLHSLIAQKDNIISQGDALLQEKERIFQHFNNNILEKEALIKAKDHVLSELTQIIRQKENDIEEKVKLITELNSSILEKDRFLEISQNSIQEKVNVINTLQQKLRDALQIVQHKEQYIVSLYDSFSWRITKPFRWLHPKLFSFFYFFCPYGSKRWSFIKRILQSGHKILTTPSGEIIHPNSIADQTNIKEIDNSESDIIQDERIYNGPGSILFVGHDAYLAGAQVLLLSLIKWFREHTGITIKVILLRNGVLLDKFKKITPTLVWEDLITSFPDNETRRLMILEFIGKVDLIYGNTVVAPVIYNELTYLHSPFITSVHELEKSIKMYVDKSTIEKMLLLTNGFIAGSRPVSKNLIDSHNIDKQKIITIHDFIEKREIDFTKSKFDRRKALGLIEDGLIILGCGTIYWRKGVDLFIDTALLFKQKGYSNFHFYWIGENIWDLDKSSHDYCSWHDLEQKIKLTGLSNHITFLGQKVNFIDYFLAGDIFYLSSREDPFPLVCLEAAQCNMPIVCFKDAGGMPDFVENDAGFVVPFEDCDKIAEKISFLKWNPDILKKLGETARKKFLSSHSVDSAGPEILNFCRKIGKLHPAVSIIVPNYNCGRFLTKRLDSILNQTFKDFEIILLDDASTDKSIEIIEKYQHLPFIKLIKNEINSGNPFIQWHKGFLHAKGEIIWFAEADDYCEVDFLEKILPNFIDDSIALAYCESVMVDDSNNEIGNYKSYLEGLDVNHWKNSYKVTGAEEINFGLGIKNSIPNASAVLIKKDCISGDVFDQTFQFKFSGDWFFYTQLVKNKNVFHTHEKLNYHRKHNQTISTKFNTNQSSIALLLKEAEIIHLKILEEYPINAEFLQKWDSYISGQILAFYPNSSKSDFNKYYPYNFIKEKISNLISKSKIDNKITNSPNFIKTNKEVVYIVDKKQEQNRSNLLIRKEGLKRFVFLTTNDWSSNGGSEQLWIQTAIELKKLGYEVLVIIKHWDPAPYFIKVFEDLGIIILFKGRDDFSHVKVFNPDLMIISIGDQDEGIEWYERCHANNISYVIVNQLTKEPEYWPIRSEVNTQVKKGYLRASKVFFTCSNNLEVMEKRLNCKIPNANFHFNPFHIDKNISIPYPSINNDLKIAIPANLSKVHKGQHLAIELFNVTKWRERPIHLNIYGEGYDEAVLKALVVNYKLSNVSFHGHKHDLVSIWKENHAIFMPSFMEGVPIVLVGAMLCARVPILTDIGVHRELIDDNNNGFLAKFPTVEALDEALERAYNKSEIWEKIGQKARNKILSFLPNDPVEDFISKIFQLTNLKK